MAWSFQVLAESVKVRQFGQGDERRPPPEQLAIVPPLFVQRVILPAPALGAVGIVVLVGHRTHPPGDGVEQAGHLHSLDGPKVAKAHLLDKGAGFLNGAYPPLRGAAIVELALALNLVAGEGGHGAGYWARIWRYRNQPPLRRPLPWGARS